jgi:hypothetical protein
VLFDLRGKRKRLVQVSYTALAAIFLVGFVGFSIGSGNAPGGLFDAIGLGGNGSSGSLTSAYDAQIDNANQQLAKNPKDSDALAKLSLNEYLKAKAGITQDPTTGQTSVSSDAHTALGESADAWTKYLRSHKGKPDASTAAQVVNAFIFLNDAPGAAKTQQIVAADQPSQNSYGNLAIFEYSAGDIPAGDAAAKKAVSLAPKSLRKQVSQQLDQIHKQAVKQKEQQAKAQKQQAKAQKNAPAPAPGANPLLNPFGGAGSAP